MQPDPRTAPAPTASGDHPKRRDLPRWLVIVVLSGAGFGLWLTAPTDGDFFWSDAPRHALNGALVLDLFREKPLRHPAAWAMRYYFRYPSLTIGFYPPFFYLIEAAFYAVLGVSHAAAQLAETLFIGFLGVAAYAFSRPLLGRAAALGVALLAIGVPEAAFWGRQVMLDIPAYALGLSGMAGLCAWLRRRRPGALSVAVFCLLAAIYTKYNTAFLLIPAGAAVLRAHGRSVLRDKQVRVALALGGVGLLPAACMIMRFGSANAVSIGGRPGDLPRDSLAAWLFYLQQTPAQLGWFIVVPAAAGLLLLAAGRLRFAAEPWLAALLVVWFAAGYAAFSLIGVREPRHDLAVLFPVILLAALAVLTLAGGGRAGELLVLALGVGTYAYSLAYAAPPVVVGYRAVADYVAAHAPPHGVVMFSGYRDGNFAFALRECSARSDLTVLRADKSFLKIAVERSRGVAQAGLDARAIRAWLRDAGVGMVVAQAGFWADLPQMARLADVLGGTGYRRVAAFPITGALGWNDSPGADRSNAGGPSSNGAGRIDVFMPTGPVETSKRSLAVELPIIGGTITTPLRHAP